MNERDPLTGFQGVMLSSLERGGDPLLIAAQVAGAAPDAAIAAWVAEWDPDLTLLTAHLVAKWATHADASAPTADPA